MSLLTPRDAIFFKYVTFLSLQKPNFTRFFGLHNPLKLIVLPKKYTFFILGAIGVDNNILLKGSYEKTIFNNVNGHVVAFRSLCS